MKTKIIATIGPASSSGETIKKMIFAGVDVFRLNFSHGHYDEFTKAIHEIRKLNKKLETHIAILADLQGPKIRIGEIEGGEINLVKNDHVVFTTVNKNASNGKIFINYPDFSGDVKKGDKILLDDGKITIQVTQISGNDEVEARVVIGGKLFSRKGVNLPNTKISLPSLSEKDKEDIKFIIDNEIEWIGLSFVRSADDIEELKEIIRSHNPKNLPMIIAKIEKPESVTNIDSILQSAHGIMIARGDLGVEMPLQTVPVIQKSIVKKCLGMSKPVIIATQMMEGMMNNSRPTRAEVNDVANSVMDGADALMLSGETSIGNFPVETVETMQKIIREVEQYEDIYFKQQRPVKENNERFISDSIIYSGCNMAREADAKAIVSVASSGYSTVKISSNRPRATIFAFANNEFTLRRLNLVWGVKPMYFDRLINTDQSISDLMHDLKAKGSLQNGDLVVHISNMPINQPGKSNMLKLSFVE
nr:pyruvate kinase [Bacteroidota bacterium]